jgi:hypothetical protein
MIRDGKGEATAKMTCLEKKLYNGGVSKETMVRAGVWAC